MRMPRRSMKYVLLFLGFLFLSGSSLAQQPLVWHPSLSKALAEAKRTGKNVFIDFTGYYCTNSRAMETNIFNKPEVIDLFREYALARLYCDNDSPLNKANAKLEEKRFETQMIPYYVILTPEDKIVATFPGFTRDLKAFEAFLRTNSNTPPPPAAINNSEVEPDISDFIEVSDEPKPIENIQKLVVYPEEAKRSALEGRVTFSALIGKDGEVRKIVIEKADNDIFRKPVLEAIKKVHFIPAKQNGSPVMVWYTQSVSFRLSNGE